MIELYVLLSLVGLGYILTQEEPVKAKASKLEISPTDMPVGNNAYESTFAKQVAATEAKAATKSYNASLATATAAQQGKLATHAPTPKVINRSHTLFQQSKLAGVPMDFSHNNMMPFFKKQGGPEFNQNANVAHMENFTGIKDVYIPKKEREPLFISEKDVGNVYGNAVRTDFIYDRIARPRIQNNIAPVDKVYVGPGLNQGYGSEGVGGFHQFDTRNYAMPKTTDELRPVNNPKMQFNARTVDGKKPTQRGKVGELAQNRAPRVYETTEDHLFKTTGAYLKNTERPDVEAKYTNRLDTTRGYVGGGYHKGRQQVIDGVVRDPFKKQHGAAPIGPAAMMGVGQGDKTDYGKANIMVYANERDVTTMRTHQGNLTSLVKAIVAPIEDIFKTTKKETMVDNPRQFGELQPTFPAKGTVHDPSQTARTTVKETTLAATELMNLKGPNKATVHDVDHVARTTVKETTLSAAELMNLKGPIRAVVYDPTDVARTTMKETLLQEGELMNFAPVERRGAVHDPNVKARTTVRQTLAPPSTVVNPRPAVAKKGQAFDVTMPARTTVKETTVDFEYTGHADRVDRRLGAYLDENYEAPVTERDLSQVEHFGYSDARAAGDAYQVTEFQAKETEREIGGEVDYYGHAAAATEKRQRSYHAEESMETDEGRELTLMGRAPTAQGAKVAVGGDDMPEVEVRRMNLEMDRVANVDRVIQTRGDLDAENVTRGRNDYHEDDRLDIELLNAFRDNPYTKPLDSVA